LRTPVILEVEAQTGPKHVPQLDFIPLSKIVAIESSLKVEIGEKFHRHHISRSCFVLILIFC